MKFASTTVTLALASGVTAFWRMPCRSQTGIGRIDPLVNPGTISDHVHTITGGGGFGPTTNFTALTAPDSCTACRVTQDHSAYWTPPLYFQYNNGTTVLVEQEGGMLVYYLSYLEDVEAFPEGFAMIAGNPWLRSFNGTFPDTPLSFWPTDPTNQFFLQQRALGFNCLNYQKAPEPSLYRHQFPTKEQFDNECTDGLRLELAFPSCGKKGVLDSPDHKSHVAYPSLVKEGNCPEGFDAHYPFLFFETIFNTHAFKGEDGFFVLSTGDPNGPSYHGDFIMGWESEQFLQDSLDTCTNPSGEIQDCPLFNIQDLDVAANCTFDMPEDLLEDDCHGPREGLPVDIPVQWGPGLATKYQVAGDDNIPTTSIAIPTAPLSLNLDLTLPFLPANPTSTSAAWGGIIVPDGSDEHAHQAAVTGNPPAITATASSPAIAAVASPTTTGVPDAAGALSALSPPAVTTQYITQGNQVIEMVVEETEVTVTASATSYPDSKKHRRHLEHHLHQHRMH